MITSFRRVPARSPAGADGREIAALLSHVASAPPIDGSDQGDARCSRSKVCTAAPTPPRQRRPPAPLWSSSTGTSTRSSQSEFAQRPERWAARQARAGSHRSEIRGFPWRNAHLDGDQPRVDVTVRADRWCKLGHPKSDDSDRSVPLAPRAVLALKAWREVAPEGRALAFGTGSDKPMAVNNLTRRLLKPLEDKAGIPHFGWHGYRHYAISTWMKICRGDFEKVRAWPGIRT